MLERFPLDEIYGAHGAADLPVGTFGFTKGFMQASADHIFITVKGKGGHGARPHTVVDPIVAAGTLIVALQTVVSRSINPMHPAVVSLGSIQGGRPRGRFGRPRNREAHGHDALRVARRSGRARAAHR